MKKRKVLVPILSAALLISALPGNRNVAKADDQEGSVQEILLVADRGAQETGALKEIFRTNAKEGEESEAFKQEVLKELKETSDTAVLIIGKDGQEQKEEDKQEQTAISESQQQMIAQVAEEFEQVVVVFNNFRPYGLEIMNDYTSIKTVTMIETADEEEMLSAAGTLCRIAAPEPKDTGEESETAQSETETMQTESEGQSETSSETEMKQSETKQSETTAQTETKKTETAQTETVPATEAKAAKSETHKSTEAAKGKVDMSKKESTSGKKAGKQMLGDINGDGVINTLDATVLMQQDKKKITDEMLTYCDVNGDKKINGKDVDLILRYATGEIKEFKVSKKLEGRK